MFNETAADTCRLLGPQCHMPLTLIDKVVHLFRHNVSCLAEAGKHTNVFQQWRDHKVIPSEAHGVFKYVNKTSPPERFRRGDVAHSWARAEFGHVARLPA